MAKVMKAIRVASTAKKTLTTKKAPTAKTSTTKKTKTATAKTTSSAKKATAAKATKQDKLVTYEDYLKKEKLTPKEAKAFVKIYESKFVNGSDPGPMIRDHFKDMKSDFLHGELSKQGLSRILKEYEREYGDAVQDGIRNGANPKHLEMFVSVYLWVKAESKKLLALK